MYGWDVYENLIDIQIIPENEEDLHDWGFECNCHPKVSKRIWDDKTILTHNAHDGRDIFDKAEINTATYHPLPKYIKDC